MTIEQLIVGLKNSDSYKTTHSIIRGFNNPSELTQDEIEQCIEIAKNNLQVYGTLNYKEGSGVRNFYRTILNSYNGERKEAVEFIKELVFIIDNSDIVSFLEEQKRVIRDNNTYKKYEWCDEQENILFTLCDGLYHANSVSTSISFIKHKKLYSRSYGDKEFPDEQTPQWSDNLDKKAGVINDIFFDNCDCRLLSKAGSAYGPVTFVLDENMLKDNSLNIRITKTNPAMDKKEWSDLLYENKYFKDIEELKAEAENSSFPFRTSFSHHTTIWNKEYIDIKDVKYIIIERHENYAISEKIKNRLKEELCKSDLCIPVVIRNECPQAEIHRTASDEVLWEIPV